MRLRVEGGGFRVLGSGFRVQGLGAHPGLMVGASARARACLRV